MTYFPSAFSQIFVTLLSNNIVTFGVVRDFKSGYGSGLSFQELTNKMLVTTTPPILQEAEPGNHYAPKRTLLEGDASAHYDRQAPLVMNTCGFPLEFNPNDISEGGHMAFWDDVKGGEFPWDANYYTETPDLESGFDPEFIMQHATDSAATAGAFATGVKMARGQLSQNLYEREVETILEEATKCGMAGGVVTSVPMFHATPGAFIIHSNNRSNRDQLQTSWKKTNPSLVMGVCASRYYPFPEDLQSMMNGTLADQWTLLVQNNDTLAKVSQESIIHYRIISYIGISNLLTLFLSRHHSCRTFTTTLLIWIRTMMTTSWFAWEVITPTASSQICLIAESIPPILTDIVLRVKHSKILIPVCPSVSMSQPKRRPAIITKWMKSSTSPPSCKMSALPWSSCPRTMMGFS